MFRYIWLGNPLGVIQYMEVFFYGLFMDDSVLLKHGVKPSNPKKGYLDDYALKIGSRASLIPCKNERSYGMVMSLDKADVDKLYKQPSVADYIPEEVTVITTNNESIKATCYNLPEKLLTGTNALYAKALYELAKQKGFPEDYLAKISVGS